ncbi:MAG: helix-turn-helix transcriptional regulator [Bacteroidia bacterium]|nr:helix-turn-helix transcriptional regulator [Bacteroidia bacterium]
MDEKLKKVEKNMCPVDYAFKRIGGKYKARILWCLDYFSVCRYGELRKLLSDISPKMLTQTLRELESDNLLARKVYHQVPPKVEYSLTEKGKEFIPFVEYLRKWGEKELGYEETNPTEFVENYGKETEGKRE